MHIDSDYACISQRNIVFRLDLEKTSFSELLRVALAVCLCSSVIAKSDFIFTEYALVAANFRKFAVENGAG